MDRLSLNGTWTMTGADGRSFPASVPGTVLAALLEQGEIADPFDGMNEYAACEVMRREWSFERSFEVPEHLLKYANAELVFFGLDTLAEVVLNGVTAARTDNMHRTWRLPVRELLRKGGNHLYRRQRAAVDRFAAEGALHVRLGLGSPASGRRNLAGRPY